MKQGYISIVIPVYNEEMYLRECLESVLNQTYAKIEIIIINDGSTDTTDEICREFVNKDKRIKYIKQSNHGVAYTKRKGVELAEGQYIGFVDGDDYIDEDMYEKLLQSIGDNDLVTSSILLENHKMADMFSVGIYNTPEQMCYICENMVLFEDTESRGMTTNLNNKLFLSDKLKDVFSSNDSSLFFGEDAEIVYKYVLQCHSICITDICAYHYRFVDSSITHSRNLQYIKNLDALYFSLKKEFEQSEYRNVLLPKLEKWIWNLMKDIPQFMGWESVEKYNRFRYLNPYINQLKNKKVILYGAGLVGQDYYKFYQKNKEVELVAWVDEKWDGLSKEGFNVKPIDSIFTLEYDYILIGVKKLEVAEEIRQSLQNMGVPEEKILWKEPIVVSGLFMLR